MLFDGEQRVRASKFRSRLLALIDGRSEGLKRGAKEKEIRISFDATR